MAPFVPWEEFPGVTEERLARLASLIRDARHSVVEIHDPSVGDDNWTMGSLGYRRETYAIMVEAKNSDWLRILPEDNGRFTFSVGSWPMKVYHGKGDDPPSKSLAVSYAELRQSKLAFELDDETEEEPKSPKLRVAIETDGVGEVTNVILVKIDATGEVIGLYFMPFEAKKAVVEMKAPPVDPGAPKFTSLKEEQEKKKLEEEKLEQEKRNSRKGGNAAG